ncbi:MAG TPA: TonB-dependent receptor [Candidatus Acidoferrales bacterium]|nr:TonB-dependent receptor [Candidatus Acidoferrales bacterium]
MKRFLAALLAAACMTFIVPANVRAQQDDTGTITIVVNDQITKAPLEGSRVVLDGPVITSAFTDKRGKVLFTDVPDGVYRARILRRGYQTITSDRFEILNGNNVTVTVTLALATQLKVIGTVVAKSEATISASSIGPDSAVRRLSTDLADAMNKLSGVTIQTSSDDSDAEQTISLEGHDASQTQLTLDGIPLNAPGSAGNIGMFATDLFMGANVRMGPQIGGLGGGVNFSTLEPTLSWESYLSMATGTLGRHNESFAETGTDGKLGMAVMGVERLYPSWLDGMTYLDASGLDYNHDGDREIGGEFVKLRYDLSDSQTLSAMFLGSASDADLVCARIQYNGIPCGYGPNNSSANSVGVYSITDDLLLGGTSIQGSIYSIGTSSLSDELNRFVNGVPSPIGSSGRNATHGFTLNALLPAAQRHTLSVTAYGSWSSVLEFPLNNVAIPYYTNSQHSQYMAAQLNDSIHSNSHLTLNESIGVSSSTGGYAGTLASLGVSWHPDRLDTYQATYSVSGTAAAQSRSSVLTDPDALRFTCDGDDSFAYGSAPGAAPQPSSSNSARVSWLHQFTGGSATLQFYRQVQNNVLLGTPVNGSVLLANGTLTPSYLAAVQQVFQSNAGCGATTPFAPTNLYFMTPIAGTEGLYQGGSITGYTTLGNLVVEPFWDTTVRQVISNSPLIDNPYSYIISGEQYPNTPLQRAGIILDYKAKHSAFEWYADAEYTGRNNGNNLPAYTQFDGAVNVLLAKGSLTAAISNIFDTQAGIFSSIQNMVPYYTQSGLIVPTIARPLTPRSYSVTYTVKFGPGALGNTHIATNLPQPRGGGRFGGGPGGPGGGGPGGGFRGAITPLPSSPPADPLAVSDNAERCPADAHAIALQISSELKAYVAQIEAAKTAAGYPATMPAPAITDATVTYHGLGSTYALTIEPHFENENNAGTLASQELANAAAHTQQSGATVQRGRGGEFRVFFGCLALHIAQPADVTTHNLYAPNTGVFGPPQVTFMPAYGLYAIARLQQQAGQESFRVYTLPSTPPKDPFEVRTAPECTGDVRNTATEALAELKAYFTSSTTPKLWTITAHTAKNGTWYGLAPGDPTLVFSLLFCGRVASGTPEEIVTKGWDGLMNPDLNYNAAWGLYLIRQPPRQNQTPARQ